jgi:hypothetical protein
MDRIDRICKMDRIDKIIRNTGDHVNPEYLKNPVKDG